MAGAAALRSQGPFVSGMASYFANTGVGCGRGGHGRDPACGVTRFTSTTGVGCGRGGHGRDPACSVTRFTSTTGRNKQHNSAFRK